jgi:hypothetical protein
MKEITIRWALFCACLAIAFTAAESPAAFNCYDISSPDSPARMPKPVMNTHRWCYADQVIQKRNFTFVFNGDGPKILPELSALVEKDSSQRVVRVTHGSRYKGQVSIFRNNLVKFNPLPVPLDPREAAKVGQPSSMVTDSMFLDAEDVSKTLFQSDAHTFLLDIQPGTLEAYLDESQMPFDAYWWPFDGVPLAAGDYSPLGKYDNIVKGWTGTSPNSSAWEIANHSLSTVAWGGHCNGWAASSVLYAEPTNHLWDAANQKVLLTSDLKGMLNEASFCVNWAFYGHRYYGNPGDDLNDIYPDLFHQVLVYYMTNVKKPVAFDYERDVPVDNSVITGYKMTITQNATDPKAFDVVADLRVHHYEVDRNENTGPAQYYTRTYSYTLETDGSGNILSGKWTGGDNPDFLWVPLSNTNCTGKNPNLDPDNIERIVNTYPQATQQSLALNFTLSQPLQPNQSVTIPMTPTKGAMYTLNVGNNDFQGDVMLVVHAAPLYPSTSAETAADTSYDLSGIANQAFSIPANDIESLTLTNTGTTAISGTNLTLSELQYLGGN